VDGSDELTRLADSADGVDRNPSWPRTGSELIFRRRLDDGTPDGNRELYRIFANGSGLQPVAPHVAQDYGPVWSRGGSLIAFLSRRPAAPASRSTAGAGTSHVGIVKAAGGQARQVGLDSRGPGYQPAWDTR